MIIIKFFLPVCKTQEQCDEKCTSLSPLARLNINCSLMLIKLIVLWISLRKYTYWLFVYVVHLPREFQRNIVIGYGAGLPVNLMNRKLINSLN
jgi:hypothetical protein